MIFDDGLVWSFRVRNESLQIQNELMKLPKSEDYFGYSDQYGVIYFIHSDERKKITKFHKSLSKEGHISVPNRFKD